jgi:hypothetical protein
MCVCVFVFVYVHAQELTRAVSVQRSGKQVSQGSPLNLHETQRAVNVYVNIFY